MKAFSLTFWYSFLSIGFVVILVAEVIIVTGQYQNIDVASKNTQEQLDILKSRLQTLQAVSPTVTEAVTVATNNLPSTNSSLLVASQIRRYALTHVVTIKNLTVASTSVPDSDTTPVQVSFTAEGTTSDLIAFFDDLTVVSPIINMDSLKLLASPASSIGQVTLNSFYAPLPSKLPSLTEPLVALNQDEQDLLTKISQFKIPSFEETPEVTASVSGVTKEDPFTPIQ